MTRERVVLLTALLLTLGVYILDEFSFPKTLLPSALYAVPIVVVAHFVQTRIAIGVAVGIMVIRLVSASMAGTPLWFSALYLVPIGLIAYLSIVFADKTRREAEVAQERERLLESERRERRAAEEHRTIVRTAMDGFWVLDSQRRLLDVNESLCAILGYSRSEMLGMRVEDFEVVESPEEVTKHMQKVIEEGSDLFETRHRRKDGTIVDLAVSVNYLPGESRRVFAFLRDITEKKQAERERERLLDELGQMVGVAQRRAGELYSILDNMVDAVYVCNAEGKIYLTNRAARSYSGPDASAESQELSLESSERLVIFRLDGSPFASGQSPLARALKGETVKLEDVVFRNQNTQQNVCFRASAAPIKDARGSIIGAISVARDVTDAMEFERLKEQFVEVAAHELKTPVTVIRGFAQYLVRRENEGVTPQGIRILQAVNRQTDRIGRIINDLLDISRLQVGRLELASERIDLTEFVEEVVGRVALTTTRHNITIVGSAPTVVRGDRSRIEQVLVNLLDNAIKYSPPRGASQGRIDVVIEMGDREAVVSVRDFGVGIPKDKQEHIFERFYRAHTGTPNDYGGIGVGLHISKEIITRHGGRLSFESEEGKGSTFRFSLPFASDAG